VPTGQDPWFYVHNDAPPPPPPSQSADPSITMVSSHTQVLLGVDVRYTLTIRNDSSNAATGVRVTSNVPELLAFIPAGSDSRCSGSAVVVCQMSTLAANATATLTLVMRPKVAGRAQSQVALTSSSADSDPSNNDAEASLTILPERIESPVINMVHGTLLHSRPTIVLTHGWSDAQLRDEAVAGRNDILWTGTSIGQASALIVSALSKSGKSANVVRFVWPNAFTQSSNIPSNRTKSDYMEARRYVTTAGYDLGQRLLQALGSDYQQDIQFIGHSLGTAVNAVAAGYFLSNATHVPRARFTALDRPDNLYGLSINGFDADYFITQLHPVRVGPAPNIDLTIENYYSTTGITPRC
jgi:uncharacterized repeat protein (TIGR01451 family)